ncbi:hypothetical protein [Vibrio scophthalmi]|uniref:Uncharacterized protein n=1 Tax=Vibrio scophthalmi LMG 19158 TaxID=870967 RepID=F9RIB2_9VIBR|nr:hypothetical protein [Vibrio scophthalmi]EGU42444.1 hypothetical protein VIS19158_11623 [Vibrio scophthalmi LMG 19158]
MQYETNPKGLSWPIKPSIIVDDLVAGNVSIYLSPEIPLSSYSLKQCFENIPFKKESKKEWIRELRQIADELESK